MIKNILIVFALSGLLSCDKVNVDKEEPGGIVRIDKQLSIELSNNSIDTLEIGVNKFILDAYLWRDFQPVSPPNGKPLMSINWLVDIDSVEIPHNIDLKEQYVMIGDSIWIAKYLDEIYTTPPYMIKKFSRNGPKWGPGVYVNVVSKIRDSDSNIDYYLKAENIYIGRTD